MATRDAVTHLLLDDEGGDDDEAIAGYYCLSGGEVRREDLPRSQAKGAPQPAPVVRMGRFAIDRRFQGKGWGGDLLREAVLAAVSAVHLIGGRAMLVDAISENAMRFYERYGFEPSPIHPMQLFKDLRVVAASAGLKN